MIPIFKYEQEAGIAEVVRSSGSLAFASAVKPMTLDDAQKEQFCQMLKSDAIANPNQFDLFYLESVLASVGWNKNDDVFDPVEIWKARYTPIDKQFNYMHDETDIIGHLTSSKIVDQNGNIITSEDNLPEHFDIVVGSVLYRRWSDEQLQVRMNQIINEIMKDKWCVSMECLFSNFDYAVVTPDNLQKIVARNDESSFLTKHLRIYGGSGEYEGYKIGRLLRGFVFSGKGLVDNPANPRSKITTYNDKSEMSSFVGAAATVKELEISNDEELNNMTISQEQYDALKAELESLKISKAQEAQKELDDAKAKIVELEKQVADLTNDLEASKEVAKAKDESLEGVKAELEETKTKLAEAQESIQAQALEAARASRKSRLLEKVEEEKANLLVDKFTNASDEMFDALLESLPAKKMMEEEDEEKDDKKKAKSDAEDDVNTDIDDANASDDADMVSGGDDVPVDKIAKASSWFTQSVLRSTANSKQGE